MTITKSRLPTEPLARATLGDRIYGDLVKRLRHGSIDRAARLVDVDLARDYGTSRMPVRQALLRLASEGYLIGTTRGFTLPRHSDADIREIFEVRRMIEPAAAGSAAQRMGREDVRRLSAALKTAKVAVIGNDRQAFVDANVSFRNAWLGAVPNRRLAETIARFADQVQVVRENTLDDPATRRVVATMLNDLHRAFLDRDAALVEARTRAFIDAAEQAYFKGKGDRSAMVSASRIGERR